MTTYTHKHDILYTSWPSQDSQSCIVSQWEFLYFPRKVSKYQFFSLECHINCLGFSMRKSLSLKVLVKYFAIIGAISVLPNRYLIITWASVLTNGSSLSFSSTLSSKSFLRIEKVLQVSRKWVSSSIAGQNGHLRSFNTIFRCLPFSIINLWFDHRNLVIDILSSTFLTLNK